MSDSQFPLSRACGLQLTTLTLYGGIECPQSFIPADQVEKMLEQAPLIYGREYNVVNVDLPYRISDWCTEKMAGTNEPSFRPWTHTARLLLIEPIKRDSAESLLREFVKSDTVGCDWLDLVNRARKLLGDK